MKAGGKVARLGYIEDSGLAIRSTFSHLDAEKRFEIESWARKGGKAAFVVT